MKFDPAIIETFARRLYSQAARIVFRYGTLYALLGSAVSALVFYYMPAAASRGIGPWLIFVIVIVFALIGVSIGNEKAFDLRLRAQIALCQVQIERNTRAASEHAAAQASLSAQKLVATHLQPVVPAAEASRPAR